MASKRGRSRIQESDTGFRPRAWVLNYPYFVRSGRDFFKRRIPSHGVPTLPFERCDSKPQKILGTVFPSSGQRTGSSVPRLQISILGGYRVEPGGVWQSCSRVCGRHYHNHGFGS